MRIIKNREAVICHEVATEQSRRWPCKGNLR